VIARQHLACLNALPGVELAAICDLSPATAEAVAERFGIRAWFTDHRAMLEKTRADVVHVTTPPTSHFKLAMDSFDAGAHVIVEKPATSTINCTVSGTILDSMDDILAKVHEAGLTQAQVAERMGTQAPSVARLERSLATGKHSPSIATLRRYVRACGKRLLLRVA
jgi:predicted XRE-type DNA-binding protein